MADVICDYSDLPTSQCEHCHPRPLPSQPKPLRTGVTISATYTSECGWCPAMMEEGDPISHTQEYGWCHEECTEPLPESRTASGFRRGGA